MKPIIRDKQFLKHYKQRIAPHRKLVDRLDERLRLFMGGERGSPLNDHALTGKKLGLRAFWLGGDLRVVYQETDKAFIFLDVGSHNQVY
jgi:addiction module RelE/StbE family toxin